MSRTLHLFGTDWCAMMVPIQVIRWYRMQCYDGTDSCATVVPIRRYCHVLSSYEKIYGRNPDEQSLGNRLNGIIQRAYEQAGVQIAIIVDEYDVPLQHTYETDHHDACREIYRNFFTGLKDYGYCIKCVFITGVTKFTQISMFGMLNTLVNISFRNEYASICGFTKDEVICNFSEHLSE